MNFQSEAELQAFLHAALGGEREISLGPSCRIDLRTDNYDIEIKPFLTSSALDKAAGQAYRYSQYSGGRSSVVAGCTPEKYDEALKRLADSHRSAGLEVWFIDQMPFFQDAYENLYTLQQEPAYEAPRYSTPNYETNWIHIAAAVVGLVFVTSFCTGPQMKPTTSVRPVDQSQPTNKSGQTVTVINAVNMRSGPSITGRVLQQALPGDKLVLTGRERSNTGGSSLWLEVESSVGRVWIVGGAVSR